MSKTDTLRTFLNDPRNTVSRERMFFNRLYFDLKLAAATRGYPLSIFEPEVDREGYDVVIDDADTQRRFQLKVFTHSSGTAQWCASKRFLLPPYPDNGVLGFETSPEGVGLGGGVIVMDVNDSDPSCPATLLYTDIYLIDAMEIGLVVNKDKTRSARTRKWCVEFKRQLGKTKHREKIKLRKPLFVRIDTVNALLAIAGFHSVIGASAPGCYIWWDHYLTAIKKGFQMGADGYPIEEKEAAAHADTAAEML